MTLLEFEFDFDTKIPCALGLDWGWSHLGGRFHRYGGPRDEEGSTVADVARANTEGDEGRQAPLSRKGLQTRARLVEAAKKVFERDGFLDARIVDITEGANLAPGGFYHYFDSKEELFLEVAQMQEERLTAPAEDQTDVPESLPPAESIRRANRLYLERYRDEAALMGVIEQVSRFDDDVNEARMATMKHFVERAEGSIRRLQRNGGADRRLNPSMAADALGAMIARVAELWLVQGYRDYDFEEAVDQLSLLWSNALGLDAETLQRKPAAPPKTRSRRSE
jgi:AcrR family transcriptional regulator